MSQSKYDKCIHENCLNDRVGVSNLCLKHTINSGCGWKSKVRNAEQSYTITSRGTKLVPQWMMKNSLKCDEVFVNRVPTLQNMAAACIVANDLDVTKDVLFNHIWNKIGNTTIDVIRKGYCRSGSRWHDCSIECFYTRFFAKAKDVDDWRETHKIVHAFPYAPYDVIFKKDAKDFSHEQLRGGLRPRKPVKRRLSFSDSD